MSLAHIREYVLLTISIVVMAQLYLIGAVAVFTLFLLVWRRTRERMYSRYEAMFGEQIILELMSVHEAPVPPTALTMPPAYKFLKRQALRRAILNNLSSISGPEREYLIRLYCQLGFADRDQRACESLAWWRRLEAISNLSALELRAAAPLFERMRRDANDLVASSAALALSALKHPLNREEIVTELRNGALSRRNLLLQIASNWVAVYGYEFLLKRLMKESRPQMIKVYVAVLSELKDVEASAKLAEWIIEDDRHHQADVLTHVLRALRVLNDPSSIPVARGLLWHEDAYVRAEALAILLIDDEEKYAVDIEGLRFDPSVAVQRVFRQSMDRRSAA